VYDDEGLEDNCPRRVAQAVLEGSKDLGDAMFTRMRRNKNVFNVLRLGRSELLGWSASNGRRGVVSNVTLILVAPLTDFSQPEDIVE
jgi:hypothetical protein